ncbi:MAG: branched-chain amino acid ABC transporter permease [Actinobacteria bacterium]|nr:branched-chain amino acid ABC transporter permease [Actinomycetota bacterium]
MRRYREFLIPVVVFGLAGFLPLFLKTYYVHIGILILIWAYLATSWNILGGYAGQHSLGHGLYMGIGAYASTYLALNFGLTPWVGMFVGMAFAAAAGWFVGYATFRYGLKGAYFALVTIALAEAAVYVVSNWKAMGGAAGLEVKYLGTNPFMMQFDGKLPYFYIILVMTLLAVLTAQWLNRRRFGYRLIAVRENEEAAEAMGVNTLGTKINANVLSAVMTAAGGTFFAQYFTYVGPRVVFGEMVSVQILLFAIIGGLGTVWGPLVGAVILVPVAEIARAELGTQFQGAHLLLYGGVLVFTMLFMPKGIVGLVKSVRSRIWKTPDDSVSAPAPEGGAS